MRDLERTLNNSTPGEISQWYQWLS